MTYSMPRGTCAICGVSVRLTIGKMVFPHNPGQVGVGIDMPLCEGSNKPPTKERG